MIRIRKKYKKIIAYIVCGIFIALLIYSIINIIDWKSANDKNKKIKDDTNTAIKQKDDIFKIDWEKLKQQNPDAVAYIKIENTNIDYVVVQGSDNEFYLNHNFNRDYSKAGWIFANYKNKIDGTDKNISLFGHARLDGSMFGTLKKTLSRKWQENKDNLIITFITEKEKNKYQVFSTYKIKDEDYYIKTDFMENEFNGFISALKERSNYNYNIDVTENDHILTFSTCDINNDYRVVLHAKLIEKYD